MAEGFRGSTIGARRLWRSLEGLAVAVLGAAALVAGSGGAVRADDHFNLESGLPVTTEDAYAIEYGGQELQSVFTYERGRDGTNLFSLEPRLAIGVLPGVQATPRVSYSLGNAEGTHSGSVGLDLLYQLNKEDEFWPTFAITGSVDGPYGFEHSSPETEVKLLAAKTLGEVEGRDVHINLGWTHNYGAGDDERSDRYSAGIAYAQPFGDGITGVVDVVREQELERSSTINLFEFGARYRVAENLALAAGVGIGFGANSPGVRVTVGFQRALDLFGGGR